MMFASHKFEPNKPFLGARLAASIWRAHLRLESSSFGSLSHVSIVFVFRVPFAALCVTRAPPRTHAADAEAPRGESREEKNEQRP